MLISHQEVLRLEEVVTDLLYLFQQKFVIAIWGFWNMRGGHYILSWLQKNRLSILTLSPRSYWKSLWTFLSSKIKLRMRLCLIELHAVIDIKASLVNWFIHKVESPFARAHTLLPPFDRWWIVFNKNLVRVNHLTLEFLARDNKIHKLLIYQRTTVSIVLEIYSAVLMKNNGLHRFLNTRMMNYLF